MRIRLTPITWFVILTIITVGLALGLPPDPQAVHQLHTTSAAYRLAIAVLLIPYILIWYASFYAFAKLQEYSRPIKSAKDGAAFHKMTAGVGTLAFSLVVPTTLSLILNNISAHNSSFTAASIIINNYLGLFPGMLAFLLIYNGARMLVGTVRTKTMRKFDLRYQAPWFLLLAVTFAHLTIENEYRYHPYHLPIWLLVVTFIVPFLYGWMVGLLSAYDLRTYAKSVNGQLYKQAVKQFANGITVLIIASIAIQFVNIVLAQRLSKSLGSILIADYILLIIAGIGLVLMALSTKKLKLIEEI